jgi:hypothetical protein
LRISNVLSSHRAGGSIVTTIVVVGGADICQRYRPVATTLAAEQFPLSITNSNGISGNQPADLSLYFYIATVLEY